MRPAAALCGMTLLGSLAACETPEPTEHHGSTQKAWELLTMKQTASATVTVDASAAETLRYLRQHRPANRETTHLAKLLSKAELSVSVRATKPLKDLRDKDPVATAAAVNFGGSDVWAVKSIMDRTYLRVGLTALARQAGRDADDRKRARELVATGQRLPSSLHAAKDALGGQWVRIQPTAFATFVKASRALPKLGGPMEPKDRQQVGRTLELAAQALRAPRQRQALRGLEKLLRQHAEVSEARGEGEVRHRTLTVPAGPAAKALPGMVRPLGLDLDADRVRQAEGGRVTARLEIRRGQLSGLRLDLGQFERGSERVGLPLRIDLASGSAVTTMAPEGARLLEPQDLVVAALYERGKLGPDRKRAR
ncbi:hypothetical protein [Streptomyces sp. NPDC005438]|uniref:hypothetical protein n=1 Tax=Streptomyces sp. NPDC005438 TaxID=3156880 RepID=UPI00339E5E6E